MRSDSGRPESRPAETVLLGCYCWMTPGILLICGALSNWLGNDIPIALFAAWCIPAVIFGNHVSKERPYLAGNLRNACLELRRGCFSKLVI